MPRRNGTGWPTPHSLEEDERRLLDRLDAISEVQDQLPSPDPALFSLTRLVKQLEELGHSDTAHLSVEQMAALIDALYEEALGDWSDLQQP